MSTQPAQQTPSEPQIQNRILLCGDFGRGRIDADFLLGGFLQLFRDHESFKNYEPLVVSADPDRTKAAFDVAILEDTLEAIVLSLSEGHALLSVGEQFDDSDEDSAQRLTHSLQRLLAGIIAGRPCGMVGAGVGPLQSGDTAQMIVDVFGRLDLITVRDQASAILLARSGLTAPAITTADPAFGLPAVPAGTASTGRLGIDVAGFETADHPLLGELAEAINRLAGQLNLKPVVFLSEPAAEDHPVHRLTETIEGLEIVNLDDCGSISAALGALGNIDVLLGTQYRLIIGAASRGIPAVTLGLTPALAGLAQQFRLGNYVVAPERMTAPAIARAAQQILHNRERIAPALHDAFQAKAARAGENIERTAHMLAQVPDLRLAEIGVDDFAEQTKSAAGEVLQLIERLAPQRKQKPAEKNAGEATQAAERKPLPREPLVTIYICAHNAGKWIEKAVAGAVNQTYCNLEILVVDDGSTDDTVAKVRKFSDPRINLHQIKHGGIARARTHAKQNFRGDLIVCLDADDWFAPELIAKQVALLQKHPEVDVTYCDAALVDENGNPTGEVWNYADYLQPRQLLAAMFTGGRGRIPNGSMMERAEVARQVGGDDLTLATTEDFDYAARLAAVARSFRGVHEPLYFCRNFMSGASGNKDARNSVVTAVWRDMWERHGGEFLLGEEPGRGLTGKHREAAYLCRAGDIACEHGEAYLISGAARHFFECATEWYLKAIALEPHNYTANSQVMKLTAAGYSNLQGAAADGSYQKSSSTEAFYANQPLLDILFEQAIPELLADGHKTINISVFQAGAGSEPYTLVLEALRRGIALDTLRIRAFDSRPEMIEKARAHTYTQKELFNKGRNHFPPALVKRYFTELPNGLYRLQDTVAENVTFTLGDITQPNGISSSETVEIVFASSLWEHLDAKTAGVALGNLETVTQADGYLFLGGYYPARDAALMEYRNLKPVRERFEDMHNGWRYRRGAYGTRPFGLEPLDQRYPEWPWRYGCAFRKQVLRQLDLNAPDLLKTYWTERGRIYQKQYPAKPLDELPVPRRIIEALHTEQPDSVLDYGCGYGAILREVRKVLPRTRLTGLDISRTVLFDGYKYLLGGTPVGLVESDGKTIPFPDDSFEATLTHVTLIHVPHEEICQVLGEMVRVTRATLYIGESAYKEHERFYYFAHDYPALFGEMGLVTEELEVPEAEKQPGTRLFRVDVTRKADRLRKAGITPAAAPIPKTAGSATQRVLVVSDRRSVHTRRFCKYFREQGHEVHLYDAGTDWQGLAGIVQHAPDPVRFAEGDSIQQAYARMARLREVITTIQPDWIHGHFLVGWGWWAALMAGDTPLALTAWGSDVFLLPQEKSFTRNLTRWSVDLADYLTADSTALVRAVGDLVGGRKQVALIPFGIDTAAFHPEVETSTLRRRLMIPENARVILSPRQMMPGANIQFIIDGFAEVAADEPDALLILKTYLTTFEKESGFIDLIRTKLTDMDLWDRVRIVHDLPQELMPAMYALAEVSLSVRDTDGTPCSLFESFAAGTPVIAGNIPSLAEWVTDGANGLLVPIRDSKAIARAIRRVLAGGPAIETIKAKAREFAIAHGDYRQCFGMIEEAYWRPKAKPETRRPRQEFEYDKPTEYLDKLNTARVAMCAAIDRQDHKEGLRIFRALHQMIGEADLELTGDFPQPRELQPA